MKTLYYELANDGGGSVTADLKTIMTCIYGDSEHITESEAEEHGWTIKPVYLTDEEYLALGESQDY